MSFFLTKRATASVYNLLVPPQNGVVEMHYGTATGAPSKMDNQMETLTSDNPVRPKILGVHSACKSGILENHGSLQKINDDEGSLPCTPELSSSMEYGLDLTSSCPSGDKVLEHDTRELIGSVLLDYTGQSGSQRSRNQSKSFSTMKRVVEDVIEKHQLAYKGMISKLSLDDRGDDMSVITSVAKNIFSDGTTNWGRIVSLVAFGSVVCQYQKKNGRENCVELVGQEISNYLLGDQRDWLISNNSWEGFVEFFRIADPESTVRNTLMAFAGVAGIGATLALLIR
ncbi:induced myeloid leukemia cell differentiation protein Mcl-1b [Hypomesus transpacificus]|uniref:induced myeloid leukemia cell differentiation protein Mcl-1b n=1 Tax=Hypomesus transpacificus TaxID=137520 RepID=UPI001F087EBF|nr:induced myeloid leukemia cell differentiation protein Mcl-1b [Hypomesus transpacificus]